MHNAGMIYGYAQASRRPPKTRAAKCKRCKLAVGRVYSHLMSPVAPQLLLTPNEQKPAG
jgi:hypothetical protein